MPEDQGLRLRMLARQEPCQLLRLGRSQCVQVESPSRHRTGSTAPPCSWRRSRRRLSPAAGWRRRWPPTAMYSWAAIISLYSSSTCSVISIGTRGRFATSPVTRSRSSSDRLRRIGRGLRFAEKRQKDCRLSRTRGSCALDGAHDFSSRNHACMARAVFDRLLPDEFERLFFQLRRPPMGFQRIRRCRPEAAAHVAVARAGCRP